MKNLLTTTILSLLKAKAFDSGQAGWKLDDDGKIVMKDGNPVYIDSNGAESVVRSTKIKELNGEAKNFRERAEKAEEELEKFKDLDPEVARKAIDTVKNIDAKKLIDAGDVEKVKADIRKEYDAKLAAESAKYGDLESKYNKERIDGVFKGNKFLEENVVMPVEFIEASFRQHFKVGKDGQIEAFHKNGDRVLSKANVGENATPSEALELLIASHPQKDSILRATGANGSGSGGGGGNRGTGRFIKRAEFDAMTPVQRANIATQMGKGEVTVTD